MSLDVAVAPGARPPRRRRFPLLVVVSAAGSLAFVPFLLAQAAGPASADELTGFLVFTSSLAIGASWFGLGWADRLGLPLPLLRAWERGAPLRLERRALLISLAAGLAFGAIGLATLSWVGMSGGSGSLAVRAASTGFAAITLEVILHLGLMSGMAVLLRGRVRAAIVVTAALFAAFHLSDAGGQPLDVALLGAAVNGLGGLVFGWLYATRGFEYLVLAHAVAHLVTVGVGGG